MNLADVMTREDAIEFLRERRQATREQVHMLVMQFPQHYAEILEAVEKFGVKLSGPRGC